MQIGFIGTGVMGTGIVLNLLKAGHAVVVYNRTKAHAQTVLDAGATWAASPADVAKQAKLVMTMVGYPSDVEAVYTGDHGIFTTIQPDSVVVDMTTSTPALAVKLTSIAHDHHALALDAPVSGGDVGAKNATLTVMVGGDRAAYDQVLPVFEQIGQRVNYFGDAGKGQHTKMANQIMIAGTMTGLTEMLVYAKAAGLDLPQVLATLSSGGADNWSMDNYVPRILKGDYTPGFFAKHFLKDLRIALQEADRMHLDLPATKQAKLLYEAMVDDDGLGNDGTQGLIKTYKQK
ncbi:MAG: NAD(P)-dependent oxidoreductase [Levilactobacillus sp.]|uniref:NAD(P)-dependent oxidoreductase n=1 Tax=Levilactobacillus sp. TaxID=2767919 RepID=UPI00258C49FF|nr:NAD(P)-dependent oxidoreductase [Levilactobacillus sp.]MCH4123657.1 NAD(P)-dependent oxidoreductase [Levilactobacillus sp.]MCI1553755.1 NAD(P)-dependent oxidoreductase [Levilactobacillus sp.]MCI1599683.1 NAD(P)-dependent oxidoreductase [Levilactobacillus sp.]